MNLRHASSPIQTQLAGNTLAAQWTPHCDCGWLDPQHRCDDCRTADYWAREHIARTPEAWEA